jgi:hypothetical protein
MIVYAVQRRLLSSAGAGDPIPTMDAPSLICRPAGVASAQDSVAVRFSWAQPTIAVAFQRKFVHAMWHRSCGPVLHTSGCTAYDSTCSRRRRIVLRTVTEDAVLRRKKGQAVTAV